MNESLSRLLDDLAQAEPDPRRAARVRSRCHAVLARQRLRSETRRMARRLWAPLLVGLAGVYVSVVIGQALVVYGVL